MKAADEQAMKVLLKYFARRKYTKTTVKRWVSIAMEYILFLEKNSRTVDDIGDLLNSEGKVVAKEEFGVTDFLDTKTQYEASYLNYLCHVLKRFYIAWEKHYPIPPEEFPRVIKVPNRPMLDTEQILKLAETARKIWLERLESNKYDMVGLRDYCMILIGIDCGARRYQISLLNYDYYNAQKKTLFIPAAKGGRDTTRILSDVANNVLKLYVHKRMQIKSNTKAMFLSRSNERIDINAMTAQFSIICKKAGVHSKGVGFHALRRAKSKRLKDANINEEKRNAILGWKEGSKMSHIYGGPDQAEVQKEAAEKDNIFKPKSDKDKNQKDERE